MLKKCELVREKQTKRIVRAEVMANKHCKRKALDTHDLVSKRIKHVRKEISRKRKKKAPEVQAQTKSSNAVRSPMPNSRRVFVSPVTVSERRERAAGTGSTARAYQISKRGQVAGGHLEEMPYLCRSRLSQKPNFLN